MTTTEFVNRIKQFSYEDIEKEVYEPDKLIQELTTPNITGGFSFYKRFFSKSHLQSVVKPSLKRANEI